MALVTHTRGVSVPRDAPAFGAMLLTLGLNPAKGRAPWTPGPFGAALLTSQDQDKAHGQARGRRPEP